MRMSLVTWILVLAFFTSQGWAQPKIVFDKAGGVWSEETNSGLQQMYDVLEQLEEAVAELPPTVERIAIHQFKVDSKHFDKGMGRFFKAQIEEVFRRNGRRDIVSAPELKTTRIIATDTSFQMSNAIPDAEALWVIGRKLRVDAFVQGAITRSTDGDMLLSIKLIKQGSAEIMWSGNFVAGPNKLASRSPSFKYAVVAAFGYMPVAKYTTKDTVITKGIDIYNYSIDFTASEYITDNKRLLLNLTMGLGSYVPVLENPADNELSNVVLGLHATGGADFVLVLLKKPAEIEGYYLGMYGGAKAVFPNKFLLVNAGYIMQATPHLGVSVGANYLPLNTKVDGGILSLNEYVLEMEPLSYDAKIYYFF